MAGMRVAQAREDESGQEEDQRGGSPGTAVTWRLPGGARQPVPSEGHPPRVPRESYADSS
jgi:hypothetical protein